MNKTNKFFLIIFAFIAVCDILFGLIKKQPAVEVYKEIKPVQQQEVQATQMCYYRSDKTSSGLYDKAWIKLNITTDMVTGEFDNLPSEKDSKTGTFNGTVGPINQAIMGRVANVWWNSLAEGMSVKEELLIQFNDTNATVGFGEMVDRGDGVYLYKDKANLTYIKPMSKIDCDSLDEKLFVEKYFKDNIKSIVKDIPALGSSWNVTSITVNQIAHIGEVTYEDGQTKNKAGFIYEYSKNPQTIQITKIETIK